MKKKAAIIDDRKAIVNRWISLNPEWEFYFYTDIDEFLSLDLIAFDVVIVDFDLGYEVSLESQFGKRIRKKGYKKFLLLSTVHSKDAIESYDDLKYFDEIHKKLTMNFDLNKIIPKFRSSI